MPDVKVSGLTPDSSVDGNHYVVLNDPSGPTTKRALLSVLASYFFNQINIPDGSGSPRTRMSEAGFDFVASGCVWSGDSYGSNRNASMTSGVVYINGRRLTISAVTARTFTASRDTYIDILDNGDGTATIVYTEVTNNNTSPALAANSMRIGIIVTGASNIANVGSVNQGQETKVLPVVSNVYYMVCDGLGNLICPRDPQRRTLGMRYQSASNTQTTQTGNGAQMQGLICPVKPATGRKVKAIIGADFLYNSTSTSRANMQIWESSIGGTQIAEAHGVNAAGSSAQNGLVEMTVTPLSATPTYYGALAANPSGTATAEHRTVNPCFLKIEHA